MNIYFVRHGESTENRGDAPRPYPPITELGREQARRAAEALKDRGIVRLYCSPMRRNLMTAAFVAEALDLPPHVLPELSEYGGIWPRDFGDGLVQGHGLTRTEILSICPNAILSEGITDEGWWFHEFRGDTPELAAFWEEQVARLWKTLFERHKANGETIALVGHGRSGSILVSAFLGLPMERGWTRFGHHNCGITHMQIRDGHRRIVFANRTCHLTPDMLT